MSVQCVSTSACDGESGQDTDRICMCEPVEYWM